MYLEVGNAEIRFETWGTEGHWVTLVNGHTRSLSDFKGMAKNLVSEGFRVLSLDNRGAGETKYCAPITMSNFSEDIVALWNHLGICSTHVLGISMGGGIAQYLAVYSAEYVKKLAIVSSCTGNAWATAQPFWEADLESIYKKLKRYFSDSFQLKHDQIIRAMASSIFEASNSGSFIEMSSHQREAIAELASMQLAEQIEQSTLVIHGDEDIIVGYKDALEMAKLIKNVDFITYEGVGHLVLAETPGRFYKNIIDFFKS